MCQNIYRYIFDIPIKSKYRYNYRYFHHYLSPPNNNLSVQCLKDVTYSARNPDRIIYRENISTKQKERSFIDMGVEEDEERGERRKTKNEHPKIDSQKQYTSTTIIQAKHGKISGETPQTRVIDERPFTILSAPWFKSMGIYLHNLLFLRHPRKLCQQIPSHPP